jgi:hypothetical protein
MLTTGDTASFEATASRLFGASFGDIEALVLQGSAAGTGGPR